LLPVASDRFRVGYLHMTNASEFAIQVVWFDDDMLELALRASNPRFAGQTTFYAALDEPERFAREIEGFPRSTDDTRVFEFGGADLPGHGGAKIRLSCSDGIGHLLVHVTLYDTFSGESGRIAGSASVGFASVPAAIDSFVESLRHMQVQVGDFAVLR
jgi:hypothetical protein